jgi:hypothetical protein
MSKDKDSIPSGMMPGLEFAFDPNASGAYCDLIIESAHGYLHENPEQIDKVILAQLMAALQLLRVRGVQPKEVSLMVNELNELLVDDLDPVDSIH